MSLFIPLGYHCNITFLSQDVELKHETGLFEWLQSEKLQYITDIVNSIKNTIDTNIIKGSDKNIHILHNKVFTHHYELEEYKIIFVRRAIRFLNIIKESREITFVRINLIYNFTSEEEINIFVKEIHSINPIINIKFLIIHTIDELTNHKKLDSTKIFNATLIQGEFLLKDCPDEFLINNIKIQKLFLNYLQEAGVNTEFKKNIQLNVWS